MSWFRFPSYSSVKLLWCFFWDHLRTPYLWLSHSMDFWIVNLGTSLDTWFSFRNLGRKSLHQKSWKHQTGDSVTAEAVRCCPPPQPPRWFSSLIVRPWDLEDNCQLPELGCCEDYEVPDLAARVVSHTVMNYDRDVELKCTINDCIILLWVFHIRTMVFCWQIW